MIRPKPEIRVLAGPEELQWAAAEEFLRQATEAVREKGFFIRGLAPDPDRSHLCEDMPKSQL